MELKRRNSLVYGLLAAVWCLALTWQVVQHVRFCAAARHSMLISHAKDISNTLGVVIHSQGWHGRVIKDHLESTLNSLVNPDDLTAIALLNGTNGVIVSAGLLTAMDAQEDTTIALTNLVDLETNYSSEVFTYEENTNHYHHFFRPIASTNEVSSTNISAGTTLSNVGNAGSHPHGHWLPRISENEIKAFALVLSTETYRTACEQDLWMRVIIMILATISVAGFGVAWGNLSKSSDLQIRLVRASEMNTHLKEMNLAAAGLAHETRNPLNIIRGLAHMISKQTDTSAEIRDKSRAILEETDKVTAQLTEFINYSRPREVRRSAVALDPVINEVARALANDLEEKHIQLETAGEALSIEADEQMFRQVLFNLLLNAVQAVGKGGKIQVVASRRNATGAALEVRDNGPGVPAEQRAEIFTPYFTTRPKGTGLGLAIVHQIVLAHGWDIQCVPNEPTGAIFRISHLKLVG